MNLKQSLIIALVLSITALGAWELYWRSKGYFPNLDDDKYLWAKTRAKVEKATENDVILVGSSRVLFDIQLDIWEKMTGIRPIQLANPGASPLPVFHDLVENTDFKGTVIVGVTPPLFFSTTFPQAPPWSRAYSKVQFYEDQTYAQKFNYSLSVPLQNTFAFISADEEEWHDDLNLKALLKTIQIDDRIKTMPPFYRFQEIDIDRNVRMKDRMVTDTAFAGTVKTVWKAFMSGEMPPPDKEGTMAYFLADAEKFKARGGKIILLRCPSDGFFRDLENNGFPRKDFWDLLVEKAGVPAYHFEDYAQLQNLTIPEWSHSSAESADKFTEEILKLLQKDGITNLKIQ